MAGGLGTAPVILSQISTCQRCKCGCDSAGGNSELLILKKKWERCVIMCTSVQMMARSGKRFRDHMVDKIWQRAIIMIRL